MEIAAPLGSVPEQRALCELGSWVVAWEMAGEACPTASCWLRSPCQWMSCSCPGWHRGSQSGGFEEAGLLSPGRMSWRIVQVSGLSFLGPLQLGTEGLGLARVWGSCVLQIALKQDWG